MTMRESIADANIPQPVVGQHPRPKGASNVAAARSMSSSSSMTVMSPTMDRKSPRENGLVFIQEFSFSALHLRRRELGVADEGV